MCVPPVAHETMVSAIVHRRGTLPADDLGQMCKQTNKLCEPEILMDGAHTIEKCAEVSEHVFSTVMKALIDHKLVLEGTLLKPNMVTPGQGCPDQKSPEEVAWYTVR